MKGEFQSDKKKEMIPMRYQLYNKNDKSLSQYGILPIFLNDIVT